MSILWRRQRHPARTVYVVYVLWLIGHSQRSIGLALGLRTKQVAGIIGKSDYANRASMPEEVLQAKLDELKEIRFEDGKPLDGGLLDKVEFKTMPLSARQRRGPLKRMRG